MLQLEDHCSFDDGLLLENGNRRGCNCMSTVGRRDQRSKLFVQRNVWLDSLAGNIRDNIKVIAFSRIHTNWEPYNVGRAMYKQSHSAPSLSRTVSSTTSIRINIPLTSIAVKVSNQWHLLYFFAGLSANGSPVLELIFNTRHTLFSNCWFLADWPLSRFLMSLAFTAHFCASCACVILNPSSVRRFFIASRTFVSFFCVATTSSDRSTLVRRWPSVPLSA